MIKIQEQRHPSHHFKFFNSQLQLNPHPDMSVAKKDDPKDVRRERITFYPVIILSAIFCVSIFIVIAATFGDRNLPVNKWVNKNANWILIVETILLVIAAIGAMTADRIRTLRRIANEQSDSHDGETTDVG